MPLLWLLCVVKARLLQHTYLHCQVKAMPWSSQARIKGYHNQAAVLQMAPGYPNCANFKENILLQLQKRLCTDMSEPPPQHRQQNVESASHRSYPKVKCLQTKHAVDAHAMGTVKGHQKTSVLEESTFSVVWYNFARIFGNFPTNHAESIA